MTPARGRGNRRSTKRAYLALAVTKLRSEAVYGAFSVTTSTQWRMGETKSLQAPLSLYCRSINTLCALGVPTLIFLQLSSLPTCL